RSVDPAIAILVDTKGAEVRTNAFAPADLEMKLTPGSVIDIREGSEASSPDTLYISVPAIGQSLSHAQRILIDDGAIELEATAPLTGGVRARVIHGGTLGSRKTVALPGVELPPLPAVTAADREAIALAVEMKIDIVAHSFVRTAADVEAVRVLLGDTDIQLYAKIETRMALDNLESIIAVADGLLVARGDLGTNISLAAIPEAQYRVARLAWNARKPVMVSTQILNSMETALTPTRAEMSDVALAVMERAEWILLCGETARGEWPRECVAVACEAIENAKDSMPYVVG
ncbi:MAG: pyruvate kinase, partial [Paramuribaculum sp.]|nr:pyruvate kinase [Paramuribaculum sp.]